MKGDDENSIILKPNYNTLKSEIEIKNNYIIGFRDSWFNSTSDRV